MVPETEDALADAIREAKEPLRIMGGGTRGFAAGTVGLSAAGLGGITLYEPGALTLVAGAGTPLAEIEERLAAEGQRLAFEPMDHRVLLGSDGEPTIGGVVAANVSGPRRVAVGACRDFMLGVRFVDGAGRVIKNGGRVMKNVTGYDLVKLMTGSYGTLGVLTEVCLKVLPRPETEATMVLEGLSAAAAVDAMSAALSSPFEVTGAAHGSVGEGEPPRTYIRIEGFADSVDYRTERLRQVLSEHGAVAAVGAGESCSIWEAMRDVAAFAGSSGAVWRISARPSGMPDLMSRLPEDAACNLDWGGGLAWVLVPDGTDLRAVLGDFEGHATRLRGTGGGPAFQPETPAVAVLSAGLRAKFDPRGILNPGIMG